MPYTTPHHTRCVALRWKTCPANSALLQHNLREWEFAFPPLSQMRNLLLTFGCSEAKIQPFSVESLQERVWEFKSFTTNTRRLWFKSQQHAGVSQRWIYSDTEAVVADQTSYLTQSQYTDTRPTSPSTNPTMPGAWQGSHWSANFKSLVWRGPEKSCRKQDSNPGSSALEVDALTTWP